MGETPTGRRGAAAGYHRGGDGSGGPAGFRLGQCTLADRVARSRTGTSSGRETPRTGRGRPPGRGATARRGRDRPPGRRTTAGRGGGRPPGRRAFADRGGGGPRCRGTCQGHGAGGQEQGKGTAQSRCRSPQ